MKTPRRRASRGRSARRPAPPVSPETDELLSLLIEVRGTDEAHAVWRAIREPMENGMSWRDVEPVMRMIQALSDAGVFSHDERFFLLASVGDSVLPTRAREDPRFDEVEREMAWLMLHNALEFEARFEEGRLELSGEDVT